MPQHAVSAAGRSGKDDEHSHLDVRTAVRRRRDVLADEPDGPYHPVVEFEIGNEENLLRSGWSTALIFIGPRRAIPSPIPRGRPTMPRSMRPLGRRCMR